MAEQEAPRSPSSHSRMQTWNPLATEGSIASDGKPEASCVSFTPDNRKHPHYQEGRKAEALSTELHPWRRALEGTPTSPLLPEECGEWNARRMHQLRSATQGLTPDSPAAGS